jgi:hypothetical protein
MREDARYARLKKKIRRKNNKKHDLGLCLIWEKKNSFTPQGSIFIG